MRVCHVNQNVIWLKKCYFSHLFFQFISLHINSDQDVWFGGSNEPCAVCILTSIGRIGKEENIKYTEALMEKLSTDLKISKERYVHVACCLIQFSVTHHHIKEFIVCQNLAARNVATFI